jgi:hypothetical protein
MTTTACASWCCTSSVTRSSRVKPAGGSFRWLPRTSRLCAKGKNGENVHVKRPRVAGTSIDEAMAPRSFTIQAPRGGNGLSLGVEGERLTTLG